MISSSQFETTVWKGTWNSTPARGPWHCIASKSFDETVTTSAAFAHLDARRENDMPLMQSSVGFVLVRTICQQEVCGIHTISGRMKQYKDDTQEVRFVNNRLPVHLGTCRRNNNYDLSPHNQQLHQFPLHQHTSLSCSLQQAPFHVHDELQWPMQNTTKSY